MFSPFKRGEPASSHVVASLFPAKIRLRRPTPDSRKLLTPIRSIGRRLTASPASFVLARRVHPMEMVPHDRVRLPFAEPAKLIVQLSLRFQQV